MVVISSIPVSHQPYVSWVTGIHGIQCKHFSDAHGGELVFAMCLHNTAFGNVGQQGATWNQFPETMEALTFSEVFLPPLQH